jgi:AraC-like DNA-binding protein
LNDIVRHFLVLEQEQPALRYARLAPDGHAGMVFCYHDRLTQSDGVLLPSGFVYGQISRFHDLQPGVRCGMLVVVLQPYALYRLTGIPAQALTDELISLPLIFGKDGQQLEDELLHAADNNNRLQLIIRFLVTRLQHSAGNTSNVILEALPLIYQSNGWMQVADLSKRLQITERQLERKFREQVGLRPKQFLRTIRFRHQLKSLLQRPAPTLTQLAHHAGYYDQPHFNREFRMLAGITPKQYMTQTRLLALNFMQLNSNVLIC